MQNHTKFLRTVFTIFLLSIAVLGCSKDDAPIDDTLQGFLDASSGSRVQALIACALGGESAVFTSASHPISILFLPEGNASNFRYYETDEVSIDHRDLSLYKRVSLNDVPVFGGFLRYFEREAISNERWGIVTYIKDRTIHYSTPIRIKYSEKPTEFNPSLLTFDQSEKLSPRFTWQDGRTPENAIYFHAITDGNGDLLSGTYTFDKTWQFYDLSNVVLNIRDVTPSPALLLNAQYQYHMLAVSLDNWVNLITQHSFDTF